MSNSAVVLLLAESMKDLQRVADKITECEEVCTDTYRSDRMESLENIRDGVNIVAKRVAEAIPAFID